MSFIIIYITNENEQAAQKVSTYLLEKKLVACANIIPIQSLYWWEGTIAKEGEVVCIVKTRSENWEKVQQAVAEIHTYTIPCIMKITVEANAAYEQWIMDETC